ncbi:hypothetical protein W97_08887 [Coniosporium apollinis CBS 100218]|uniref:SCP domain-containing protein n=1 Tax=Coniosporium apollinis (strain CBS 100218) TaxID=1168221 RepID=R7Z649_CONA1|nr:uncharacterized protein W97_08887 [Coniosporium apollinis CBS 100218]EON69627.1 hypothetical protein W97_08887 [Coniosporium apollinis CBS 100218]
MRGSSAACHVLFFLLWVSATLANPIINEDTRSLEKRAVPPAPTDPTFISTILSRVNVYRNLHSAPPVTWDAGLAQTAKTAATRCSAVHTPNNRYGENIYSFYLIPKTRVPDFNLRLKKGIDWWYGEVRYYDVNNPAPAYHFTQLVWKSTKKIGCSWSPNQCATPNGDYFLVCEFDPQGNQGGQFHVNVLDA